MTRVVLSLVLPMLIYLVVQIWLSCQYMLPPVTIPLMPLVRQELMSMCQRVWQTSCDDKLQLDVLMTSMCVSGRGKNSKTSDMGMYGTSKLYLLMFVPGLQQRLRVSPASAAQR